MARLTAPLLSLGASGQIAKSLVFSTWKGIDYARVYVIPENPNTVAQQETRGVFSTLVEMWKRMPVGARTPFLYAVRGQALTDRNKHLAENIGVLRGQATLDNLVMSVSSGSAVPPASMTPSDAGGQVLNVALTAPTLPPGYTLEWMEAAAVLDGDPSPAIVRTVFWAQDDVAPYAVALSVGVAGTYQVAGWCHFASLGTYYASAALRATQVIA